MESMVPERTASSLSSSGSGSSCGGNTCSVIKTARAKTKAAAQRGRPNIIDLRNRKKEKKKCEEIQDDS
jgi:hypothetical protein